MAYIKINPSQIFYYETDTSILVKENLIFIPDKLCV